MGEAGRKNEVERSESEGREGLNGRKLWREKEEEEEEEVDSKEEKGMLLGRHMCS